MTTDISLLTRFVPSHITDKTFTGFHCEYHDMCLKRIGNCWRAAGT